MAYNEAYLFSLIEFYLGYAAMSRIRTHKPRTLERV